MKRLCFLGLIFSTVFVHGSTVEQLNKRFVVFFLDGDMDGWKQTIDSLRNVRLDIATEKVLLYAEYGLIGNYVGSKRYNEARNELTHFEQRIAKAIERRSNDGDLYAFSAAMVAFKIALQPWRAPFLSRSHSESIRKAVELSPNKGLPIVEQANSLYFRPSIVGGNKEEAVKAYERAHIYYKTRQRNHWMYYNISAWLGQVYANQGEKNKAEKMYLDLLKEVPDFKWVRDELLPQLYNNKSNNYFDVE